MRGYFHKLEAIRALLVIGFAVVSLASRPARAEPVREFIMSCTYGVLAGTLVGAATLAFTDQPGENLNNIARGASIGLYAGMLLGFYVVYGVSDDSAADPASPPSDVGVRRQPFRPAPSLNSQRVLATDLAMRIPRTDARHDYSYRSPRRLEPALSILPLLSENGLEGVSLRYALVRF
jgi:hypothetical protein